MAGTRAPITVPAAAGVPARPAARYNGGAMGTEIERKFLVIDDRWKHTADAGRRLRQGYLSLDPDRTVRVRQDGDQGWLTIKGRAQGVSRLELEYPVPLEDADLLLDRLCHRPLVEKTRYLVPGGEV